MAFLNASNALQELRFIDHLGLPLFRLDKNQLATKETIRKATVKR